MKTTIRVVILHKDRQTIDSIYELEYSYTQNGYLSKYVTNVIEEARERAKKINGIVLLDWV